jgi:multicomponent Na+:H+ antiporter subunit F
MSTEQTLLDLVIQISIVISSGLTLLCGYRVIKGPTVPDRMVALDTVSTNIVAIGALTALMTGKGYFILISLVLTIIGFISTTTVAMYIDKGDIIT